MDVAAGLRAGFERELTALREELQQQVVWERETYVRELTAMGARMEDLRFELTRTADDLRAQLSAEPLDDALSSTRPSPSPSARPPIAARWPTRSSPPSNVSGRVSPRSRRPRRMNRSEAAEPCRWCL